MASVLIALLAVLVIPAIAVVAALAAVVVGALLGLTDPIHDDFSGGRE